MAVPKQRHSKSRGKKRRTHYRAEAPNISLCENCQEAKLPHHVCPHCGHYNGEQIETKVEEV